MTKLFTQQHMDWAVFKGLKNADATAWYFRDYQQPDTRGFIQLSIKDQRATITKHTGYKGQGIKERRVMMKNATIEAAVAFLTERYLEHEWKPCLYDVVNKYCFGEGGFFVA